MKMCNSEQISSAKHTIEYAKSAGIQNHQKVDKERYVLQKLFYLIYQQHRNHFLQ